jgi:hypothetical protein
MLPALQAQQYTRGVGVYPGDPKEDFAAQVVADTSQAYRNLALHRAAYQSSSYDFNLTGQLATDGIKETTLPRWYVISTNEGPLSRQLREHAQDHNVTTNNILNGSHAWMQFEFGGGDGPPELDRVETANVSVVSSADQPAGWTMTVRGSDDGRTWTELGRTASADRLPAGRGFGGFGGFPAAPGAAPGAAGAAGGGRGVAGNPGAAPPPGAPGAAAGPGGPIGLGAFGGRGGPAFTPSVAFTSPARKRFIRVEFEAPAATRWTIAEMILKDKGERVDAGGPYHFSSAWKAASTGGEWLYVDLGAVSTFDKVILSWLRRPADGVLQSSDDAKIWKTVRVLPTSGDTDELKLDKPERARYVRVFLTKAATPDGYILTEMEVWGRGGVVARPKPAPVAANGRLKLSAGGWRIERDSLVKADGAALSKTGFNDKEWLPATVPGTVVSTYFDDGAIPDPAYDNNMMMLSDSFFWADFWYRNEFVAPPVAAGQRVWLNFTGVNWKAEVFLNGERIGRIDGGFMRGRFDVTGKLKAGEKSALAVRIIKNATPGSIKEKTLESPDPNGGALGADNPTYHATAGWDWIPSVRGRDIGIWADVYLEKTGPVTIEDPYVSTTLPLPNTGRADVSVEATLRNATQQPVSGTFRGRFGTVAFESAVTVDAGATKTVKLDPSTTPALRLQNPKLWWPAGYGEQNLYAVQLSFVANGTASDTKAFKAGVKQYTYTDDNAALKIYINGQRLIGRGGNWGFPEELLRFRSREYDWAVRYHKDMNFTMIRNWVGQTGDDEFYDACDKYGIVVWQDFWLANPVDGPNPDDPAMFLANAKDYILKVRNHASIGLWVGRNEGNPPEPIESGLIHLTQTLQPGSHYIPSSAGGTVSGGGPYRTQAPKVYFQTRATTKLHSELGMPNVLTLDSVKQMMRPQSLWPMNDVWGEHDFTLSGAQGASTWLDMIDKDYGGAKNVEDFVELSQFIDYDGYRAMFEAQGKNRMGILLWMSHSCWPSFVWTTYDYYFDQSGAYFGSKKANEPLHIQWNPTTDNVEVVNYSAGAVAGLTANIEIDNMDGSKKWEKSATLDSKEDSVETPIKIEYPAGLTPVHFLRLKLTRGVAVVSDNFYLRGLEETQAAAPAGRGGGAGGFGGFGGPTPLGYNLSAIRQLPKVKVEATTTTEQKGSRWLLTTTLRNASSAPALMVRVKAVRSVSGDRILPAIYSDNYVALMPGEKRTIKTELENADTRGERPRAVVEGFNVEKPAAKPAVKPAPAE